MGELLFLDLTYVVNINTLAEDALLPCDEDMNVNYDTCLVDKVGETLAEKYGCVVPYLPRPAHLKNVRCVQIVSELNIAHTLFTEYSYSSACFLGSTYRLGKCQVKW